MTTPITNVKVRTVRADPKNDWEYEPEFRKLRRWGVIGTIVNYSNSHGTCFGVRHDDDGSIGAYEPEELVLIDPESTIESDLRHQYWSNRLKSGGSGICDAESQAAEAAAIEAGRAAAMKKVSANVGQRCPFVRTMRFRAVPMAWAHPETGQVVRWWNWEPER